MIELNLYHVSIPALKMYLVYTGLTIVMIVFPFLSDITDSIYCFFPLTSLLTWIVSGDQALIQGLIKVGLYFFMGMIMMHNSHGLTMVLSMVFPVLVEVLLYGFTDRMINIDECLVVTSAMMVEIIIRMVRKGRQV